MILLSTADRRRYFLVPAPEALETGELIVQSMTGEPHKVSAEAAARYEVPEAVAQAWAEEKIDGLTTALATARTQFDQMSGEAGRHIEALSQHAGVQDPTKMLAALGIDPSGKPDDILHQLTELVRRLGAELPEAARGVLDLQERLKTASSAASGKGLDASAEPLDELLATIGDNPDADPQLREAVAELQDLARSLDAPSGKAK